MRVVHARVDHTHHHAVAALRPVRASAHAPQVRVRIQGLIVHTSTPSLPCVLQGTGHWVRTRVWSSFTHTTMPWLPSITGTWNWVLGLTLGIVLRTALRAASSVLGTDLLFELFVSALGISQNSQY